MRRLDSITDSMDTNLSKLQEIVQDRGACVLQSMGSQRVRHELVAKQQLQVTKNLKTALDRHSQSIIISKQF